MPLRARAPHRSRPQVLGHPLARGRPLQVSHFPVIEHRLPNGLRVRLLPDSSVPAVSVHTFFGVGSRHERPGCTGIAHLFEHLYFNGATRYGPGEFDRVLEAAGGHSNAYTSHDMTAYFADAPAEALELVLDLESDRMGGLALTEESLRCEREVVKEERRLAIENEAMGLLDEDLFALAFRAHPYRSPIIGWMEDLERLDLPTCQTFFRTYYAPSNATLWVVGDFQPAQALQAIERFYGDIPAGPPVPEPASREPPQRGERRARVRFPAHAEALVIGYRAPSARDPRVPVLDVLQYVLGVGEGARLVRALIYDALLASDVSVDMSWRLDPGLMVLMLELNPNVSAARALERVDAELARVAREGITERELQRAQGQLRAQVLRELATLNGRAGVLGAHELLAGDWRSALALPRKYQRVTPDRVRRAAQELFREDQRSVVTLQPLDPTEASHG